MTLSLQTSRVVYTGNGSTTQFAIPFPYFNQNDIVIYVNDTLQVFVTDYAIIGGGLMIAFVVAPLNGTTITVYRDPPLTQTTDYSDNDAFPASATETAFDKTIMIDQRTRDLVSRCLHISNSETGTDLTLPSKATRSNKLLGFDANGEPIPSVGLAGPPGPPGPAGPIGPTGLTGGTGGAAGGNTTEIQFNDGSNLTGDSALVWDKTNNRLTLAEGGAGGGLKVSGTNANITANPDAHILMHLDNVTDGSGTNPSFTNEEVLAITLKATHGQATNGGITTAKKTFLTLSTNSDFIGSGQKFMGAHSLRSYSMGDTAIWGNRSVQFAGGPVNGDEGQGWGLVSDLKQQGFRTVTTITSIPAQSAINTTVNQLGGITANRVAQTVTVVSTAGATNDDWVVIQQQVASPSPNLEAVKIQVLNATQISGIFTHNHPNGVTVLPAKVFNVNNIFSIGQDRVFVNLSGASYSTGTVTAVNTPSGGKFTGSGGAQSWSVGMVGGNALNIGVIQLDADAVDYFFGGANPLRSWYQINAIDSTTVLNIHSLTTAGSGEYHGKGPGAGAYVIRPSAKCLRVEHNGSVATGKVICENSTHTWTVGDTVEQIICPYADVTGYQYHLSTYSNGGTYRHFMQIINLGARSFESCFKVESLGGVGTGTGANNSDLVGWDKTIHLQGTMNYGLFIEQASIAAIHLSGNNATQGRIEWTGTVGMSIAVELNYGGMQIGGSGGGIQFNKAGMGPAGDVNPNADRSRLISSGDIELRRLPFGTERPSIKSRNFRNDESNYEQVNWFWDTNDRCFMMPQNAGSGNPRLFIISTGAEIVGNLPTASAALKGARSMVTNSTVVAAGNFGAIVAAGGVAATVPVWCDGTNWRIG